MTEDYYYGGWADYCEGDGCYDGYYGWADYYGDWTEDYYYYGGYYCEGDGCYYGGYTGDYYYGGYYGEYCYHCDMFWNISIAVGDDIMSNLGALMTSENVDE